MSAPQPVFVHGTVDVAKLVQAIFDEFGLTAPGAADSARIVRQLERILPVTTEEEAIRCHGCKTPIKLCTQCMLWRKGKKIVKQKAVEAGPQLIKAISDWLNKDEDDPETDAPQREK